MNLTKLINLKERIAISDAYTPDERDFILDAINDKVAAAAAATEVHAPRNYLGRIDAIWAVLSLDDGGEGLCAAPVGRMTLPLIAADKQRLTIIRPIAARMATLFRKPVRIAKFTGREDVEIFQPMSSGG